MKTEDLSFEEALKLLQDGKCKQIADKLNHLWSLKEEILVDEFSSIAIPVERILDKWRLININKEKKKIVIENVDWYALPSLIVYPSISTFGFRWTDLIDKPKMKMTLEWEE